MLYSSFSSFSLWFSQEELKWKEKHAKLDSKKLVYRWYVMYVHNEDENGTMRSY